MSLTNEFQVTIDIHFAREGTVIDKGELSLASAVEMHLAFTMLTATPQARHGFPSMQRCLREPDDAAEHPEVV